MSDVARFQTISPVIERPAVLFYSKRIALAEGIAEGLRQLAEATVTIISEYQYIGPMVGGGGFSVLFIDCAKDELSFLDDIQSSVDMKCGVAVATLFDELDNEIINSLLDRGIMGIMVTSLKIKTISAAIQMVAAGECYVADSFHPTPVARTRSTEKTFSRRELNVLNGLMRGLTNQEISDELNLALPTVKMYVSAVFRKLGVRSRLEAAVIAQRIMPGAVTDS